MCIRDSPYREDGRDAVNETVRWMDIFARLVNRIDDKKMEEIFKTGNACEDVYKRQAKRRVERIS